MFDTLDDQSLKPNQSNLSSVGRDYARRTIPWLRLAGFVTIGICSLGILSTIGTMFRRTIGPDSTMSSMFTLALLSVAVYLGVLLLYQASDLSKYQRTNDAQSLEDALSNARTFWKSATIFSLTIAVMTILSILFIYLFFSSFPQ